MAMAAGTGTGGPRVVAARGPRALEERLLSALEPERAAGRSNPRLLTEPLRVVVPSRSLAEHLSARIAGRLGAVLGIALRTSHALAQEVLARAGEAPPAADRLLPLLVRRHARAEAPLREPLEGLEDGYAVVEASVRDLLDAGFEAAHADAAEEALRAVGDLAQSERQAAVLRVAARVADELATGRVGHASQLLRRARELLEADRGLLPARAVWVYGFSDATGVQLDLLAALLRVAPGTLFLDRPPDPEDAARDAPGMGFTRALVERLAAGVVPDPGAAPPAEPPAVWHAPGPHAEARAVAEAVSQRLAAGVAAERIGIVARDLAPYALPLRQHLTRLGVPFSGIGAAGPHTPAGRRVQALCALLREGARLPAERWLDAVRLPDARSGARLADLRHGLHSLGVARLEGLARLPAHEGGLKLAARVGFEVPADAPPRARRRRLGGEVLAAATAAAAACVERLGAWPQQAPLAEHLRALEGLVCRDLGWRAGAPERAAVEALWRSGDGDLGLEAERADFALYVERELRDGERDELGGAGAGVQVLSVMEARERSFDALFVLGMNRDLFPRLVTEDPLLPDALRAALRSVLPELPIKREGAEEERFLFAQLLAASPETTLACSVTDDDGGRRQPSPLVERLRLVGGVGAPRVVHSLWGRARFAQPATAFELAQLCGLHASRARFAELLPDALAEGWREWGGAAAPGGAELARGRLAVLREIDALTREGAGLSPYLGLVGAVREAADPRRTPPYVTAVERMAVCPWQAFLGRLLRLEEAPDALAPWPKVVDKRLIGAVVHRVLDGIADRGVEGLEEALDAPAERPPWPEPDALRALALDGARQQLGEEGIALPGFERVVAAAAQVFLERARALEWTPGPPAVLGAEVTGTLRLRQGEGPARELRFRADRVDRTEGGVRLIDYKAGRALKAADLAKGIAAGEILQVPAYAEAARQAGWKEVRAEYVYLDPDLDEADAKLAADDEALAEGFRASVRRAFEAWDRGVFFPRLAAPDGEQEPGACRNCEVKEACWRGDTGARARLAAWAAAGRARGPEESALLDLWRGEGG